MVECQAELRVTDQILQIITLDQEHQLMDHKHQEQMEAEHQVITMDHEHHNTKDHKHQEEATIHGAHRVNSTLYTIYTILDYSVPNTPRDDYGEFDHPTTPGDPTLN